MDNIKTNFDYNHTRLIRHTCVRHRYHSRELPSIIIIVIINNQPTVHLLIIISRSYLYIVSISDITTDTRYHSRELPFTIIIIIDRPTDRAPTYYNMCVVPICCLHRWYHYWHSISFTRRGGSKKILRGGGA